MSQLVIRYPVWSQSVRKGNLSVTSTEWIVAWVILLVLGVGAVIFVFSPPSGS